jgi:hypothetical protein
MAGQLKIDLQPPRRDGAKFTLVVAVSGGQPGDEVTVRLQQTAGVKPLFSGTARTPIDGAGNGNAVFDDVVVHGAGSVARLVADDAESAVFLSADETHIDVVP